MLTGTERFNQLPALLLQTSVPQSPPVMAAIIAKITREARERKVVSDTVRVRVGEDKNISINYSKGS